MRRTLKTCRVCQVAKPGGNKPLSSRQRLDACRPWQNVAIDLVGPIPRTQKKPLDSGLVRPFHRLAGCHFTVATALVEVIFCYFGLPEQIYSDLGKQIQPRLMAMLCSLWRVDQTLPLLPHYYTHYHPQSNGAVERGNKVLGDALRAFWLDRGQGD